MTNPYQLLPGVYQLLEQLNDPGSTHTAQVAACRAALERARLHIREGFEPPSQTTLVEWARAALQQRQQASLRPVINATGVIVHTNLGRAPLSEEALAAMQVVGAGYSNLEFDLARGKRGKRQTHIEDLIVEITGAEASVVVNNNAAAVLLVLGALCRGKEVIVSRGQLVEIGGGYRIPEVMQQGGVKLVEVGTTNRTRPSDYINAITTNTAAIMRVHSSNFKQIGFTQEVPLPEMVEIAREHDVIVLDDLGSGTLIETAQFGLQPEPTVHESVQAGADLTMFSGDKLLGGPQAGIIIGRRDLVETVRRFPLMRSLRPDKTTIAALAQTLQHYRDGEALEKIPVWQMISMPLGTIKARAERWQQALGGEVITASSTVGGGSLPGDTMPSYALALEAEDPDSWLAKLRSVPIPIIARIHHHRVVFDPRTVFPAQDDLLLGTVQGLQDGTQ
jgi:L-seryl-tRNA(Ser) seleniumtransferase